MWTPLSPEIHSAQKEHLNLYLDVSPKVIEGRMIDSIRSIHIGVIFYPSRSFQYENLRFCLTLYVIKNKQSFPRKAQNIGADNGNLSVTSPQTRKHDA
jgi:hypothetical protein